VAWRACALPPRRIVLHLCHYHAESQTNARAPNMHINHVFSCDGRPPRVSNRQVIAQFNVVDGATVVAKEGSGM